MAQTVIEKTLAPFQQKGALVNVVEPCVHDRNGDIVKEGKFDLMEREFRAIKRSGAPDPNSGASLVGSEADFVEVARQARDDRLVGMTNGVVVRAAGNLNDGSGALYDMNGRPVSGSVQQAPVRQTKRSPRDW